ncbi:MAG: flagellar motor switch protein FliN [Planctomycetota bacterium]
MADEHENPGSGTDGNDPGSPPPSGDQPMGTDPEDSGPDAADDPSDEAAAALRAAQAAVEALKHQSDTQPEPQPGFGGMPAGAAPLVAPSFDPGDLAPMPKGLDLLSDVDVHVTIELGRTRMLVEDVLRLARGAVVELDKLAGDPVDVYVNERLVARGEVLVLNDNFCVRVNEILEADQAEPA